MNRPTALLGVGGPIIVKWPADKPAIERIARYDEESIGVWTVGHSQDRSNKAMFMVLQDFDPITHPGELVGSVVMPWFGECRVFRLREH